MNAALEIARAVAAGYVAVIAALFALIVILACVLPDHTRLDSHE